MIRRAWKEGNDRTCLLLKTTQVHNVGEIVTVVIGTSETCLAVCSVIIPIDSSAQDVGVGLGAPDNRVTGDTSLQANVNPELLTRTLFHHSINVEAVEGSSESTVMVPFEFIWTIVRMLRRNTGSIFQAANRCDKKEVLGPGQFLTMMGSIRVETGGEQLNILGMKHHGMIGRETAKICFGVVAGRP